MQKFQESVFSIVKTTSLSPAVFSFLQPSEDTTDKTPLGGIFNDTRHGWLALGPKFCVVDLKSGLKIAAKIFGTPYSNSRTTVTSVAELPIPLTDNSKQLLISLCEDGSSTICVFHINGSQTLRCIQTDVVVTELAICDELPNGPFTCFDGIILAGTRSGEVFAFDLNRAGLMQALKDILQGNEQLKQNENNPSNITFLPLNALQHIEEQRELAVENNDHLAILLNESSMVERQYIFRNPDGSVRMKAKREHVRVTVLQFIPQLGSLAVGYNFGAFQLWNLSTLELEYTSHVNLECMPVTHFGFQEPCDDPRAFCYLWVVYSVTDRFEEEEFPLAVMYSLTYHGKRLMSDTSTNAVCLYQEFSMASIRFQVELTAMEDAGHLLGGRCVSCHTYSINSTLGSEGEDSMLNICQLVWECWGESANASQYGMLLFDLDQWYKDQMPETYRLQSNAFMSATWCPSLAGACTLAARLAPASVASYSHCTRLEEHFYPNALQYSCICLTTSEASVLGTVGIQRQIISSLDSTGPTALLNPTRLYSACLAAGLSPLYTYYHGRDTTQEEQRKFLLSVALEARLSRFLKRCAHDWAVGSHTGAGCTLTFLVDWCWQRAIELKENAKELTAPLFSSAALPDRNVVRCLEHCVQQLAQLTGLLDAVLTKCCNLVVPDALSEMEEKYKGIGTVSLYFQVVEWFLRVGLLPERHDAARAVPYPAAKLRNVYNTRRLKLQRLQDNSPVSAEPSKSCSLLYIDQLIENEFGGERVHQMWMAGGSECHGLYPPPSLYSLLRLYLLPDIADEHKHSLVLYLLVDYSLLYDKAGYEAVIRRLMQFPTMFGLSNTAIKATQAFWHLDHRDFDFALDQLQCLTGNTLSEWQHNVVLSSLLAQKKTQAALQYLHVRKPAPIQIKDESSFNKVNDHDKLEDWQSCCSLYLARELVFEALDVVRMCVQNAGSLDDKTQVLNFFFKGCRNTGQLSRLLQVTLLPLEEQVFINYLQNCNESQTSDILVMYYLQHARYIEAEQYNKKLHHSKSRSREPTGSVESLVDVLDRDGARDTIVKIACSFLPAVTGLVRDFALCEKDIEPHVIAPKPMSVYVQARSPKNTFTYKSSFIQDTIENASEIWMNKPKTRRGLKRALNVEETPFICTPKLTRNRSIFTDHPSESTPSKRAKLDLNSTPRTPKFGSAAKVNDSISKQMSILLDMPEVQSPECKLYIERSAAGTPHSILKTRRNDLDRDAPSPADSRYLDSDDELLDSCSNQTLYSDSTNKHLRFTIPTASESGSTPSPAAPAPFFPEKKDFVREDLPIKKERDDDTAVTSDSHAIDEPHPLESPPKKLATEDLLKIRKSYKDTVKSRRSLSISANSSLSDDPNTSIESIADIPITLINPRYSGEKRREQQKEAIERELQREAVEREDSVVAMQVTGEVERDTLESPVPKTPKGRRGIRASGDSTPLMNRSRSHTPERMDSPLTPLILARGRSRTPERMDSPLTPLILARGRSRTPELSPTLATIPEAPRLESISEPHLERSLASATRRQRSRSRTPERIDKPVSESPRLEAISESPTKSSNTDSSNSPSRRTLRSRSRTPEVEVLPEQIRPASPRSLRRRSRTPEVEVLPEQIRPASPRSLRSRSRTPERIDKLVSESPRLEAISESPTKSSNTDSSSSPSRRSLRSRSHTPERIDKPVSESPRLEAISESPTKSSNTDSSSSPSRRSLRSRSRTPEVEVLPEQIRPASPRSLRSRAKTPEKIMSPKVEHSARSKKSLSRIVLEANAFAKSKMNVDQTEQETEASESAIECTPMKTIKQVSSLMDVTLSPIVNKSVLQSSTDSALSETVDNTTKLEDKSIIELGLKPLPAFTTLHETYYEKSVLHSYQSSVADSSQSMQESRSNDETAPNVSLKSLPCFTTLNEMGAKSVLNSYESSVAETSQSMQEEKDTKTVDANVSKHYMKFSETVEINIEKSVLKSYESSMAESSRDVSMSNTKETNDSAMKNISLITNDSDVEMKDEMVWNTNIDSQATASVIQKEKEKIVDIEREINELEGDMTDDTDGDESNSGDEEIVIPEGEQLNVDSSDEALNESSGSDEEIISILETDGCSSSPHQLRIDEDPFSSEENQLEVTEDTKQKDTKATKANIEAKKQEDSETNTQQDTEDKQTIEEVITQVYIETSLQESAIAVASIEEAEQKDPLSHAHLSMLTDDNSVVESEKSDVTLNYSNEKGSAVTEIKMINEDIPMETEPAVQMAITVQDIATTVYNKAVEATISKDIDVVDSITSTDQTAQVEEKLQVEEAATEENQPKVDTRKDEETTKTNKPLVEERKETETESIIQDTEKQVDHPETIPIDSKVKENLPQTDPEAKSESEVQDSEESKKPASRTSKRVKSTSSNKSISETKPETIEEPSTPATRKRTQSNASSKSVEPEQKTPENEASTPRRRAKTPTSTEVRKIITRRASKEISEKMDDSKEVLDDSLAATPKRRSARSRSKNIDDNESVTSESSVKSTKGKTSEHAGDVKPAQVRKGRRSILNTKPDLSVIPEMTVEEESKKPEDIIKDYSSARRLTRNQKAVLESWLEPGASPRASPRPISRARRASTVSRASDASHDDDDASPTYSGVDAQPIDRFSSLSKQDFEDSSEPDETLCGSPDSFASEMSQLRAARIGQASSETKSTPKSIKPHSRRVSVDVLGSPERGSPAAGTRSRRASFNKACEALNTPKGRRPSTDSRKDADSPQELSTPPPDVDATPARRARRTVSTQSNSSQAKSDAGKRSKKTALDGK